MEGKNYLRPDFLLKWKRNFVENRISPVPFHPKEGSGGKKVAKTILERSGARYNWRNYKSIWRSRKGVGLALQANFHHTAYKVYKQNSN